MTALPCPWRSPVPVSFSPCEPPYMACVPRSAPLLSAVASALDAWAASPDSVASIGPQAAALVASGGTPSVVRGHVRLPPQIPVGPLADCLGALAAGEGERDGEGFPVGAGGGGGGGGGGFGAAAGLLDLTLHPDVPGGFNGDAAAAAQQSFCSSVKQGIVLRAGPATPPVPAMPAPAAARHHRHPSSSASSASPLPLQIADLPKETIEKQWAAAKDGEHSSTRQGCACTLAFDFAPL
jgi:hypothetical protein